MEWKPGANRASPAWLSVTADGARKALEWRVTVARMSSLEGMR